MTNFSVDSYQAYVNHIDRFKVRKPEEYDVSTIGIPQLADTSITLHHTTDRATSPIFYVENLYQTPGYFKNRIYLWEPLFRKWDQYSGGHIDRAEV